MAASSPATSIFPSFHHHRPSLSAVHLPRFYSSPLCISFRFRSGSRDPRPFTLSTSGPSGPTGPTSGGGGGGGGNEDDNDDEGGSINQNRTAALLVLHEFGRRMDSLPADLAAAIEAGRIPGEIVRRFFELEKSALLRWLLQFGGFKERLLADDLFLTKVAIECGVGIFTKTAAELEKRKENFSKELDFVCADVVMALVADFMLVWLPAPTISLKPPIAVNAGQIANFLYNCPDNAFQVPLPGTSYSILQRGGAILRNGAKLFGVGTGASLIGTGVTNALIYTRKAFDKDFAGKAEDVPIISTSVAYGVYMAVSSNLRYQILAGVVEQRILEPLLHNQKLALSAMCFAVRTGNTFLGSLMWVDYARWVGVQKIRFKQLPLLAVNFDPPCPQPDLALGFNPHTNANSLTVLLQDEISGLEIMRGGKWVEIPPFEGALTVVIGDQIQVLSNDKYKSVIHCVMLNSKRERFSVPIFLRPSNKIPIKPAEKLVDEKNPDIYRPYFYKEYISTVWSNGLNIPTLLNYFKV